MTNVELMEDLLQMLNVATDDMKLSPDQVLQAALGTLSVYTCARFKNPADIFAKALASVSADAMSAAAEMKGKSR
jgi:hypothetical protein